MRLRRVLLACWITTLILCAALRPLQLDEILELFGARQPSLGGLLVWLRCNPGAAPLGYLIEWLGARVAGLSSLAVRLPSIAAMGTAVVALYRIRPRPAIDALMFLTAAAALPMLFRYSVEARPYALAFLLSSVATILLFETRVRFPSSPLALYGFLLATAPLFQLDAVFVTIGHLIFLLADRSPGIVRRKQIGIALLSMLPAAAWYFFVRAEWSREIVVNQLSFAFDPRSLTGFLRDLSGGGIICTGLLLLAAIAGFFSEAVPPRQKRVMVVVFFTVLAGVLVSDASAGYYLASRQAIYCLFPLLVFGAAGWERLRLHWPWAACLAFAVFLSVSLGRDVSIIRSKENWELASRAVTAAVREGFCLKPASDRSVPLAFYSFFDPSLDTARCTGTPASVLLLSSNYVDPADRAHAQSELLRQGLHAAGSRSIGGSYLERYTR